MRKVLIANRGEIAVRVIRACHDLGLQTVAVYSQADARALHVLHADEAICIGRGPVAHSYLKHSHLLAACEISGADAIHPGYGFLSESAKFAEICRSCGLQFIGPSPEAISLLGNKASAKQVAQRLGIPTLPGSDGPVENVGAARGWAKRLGYPILIKAVSGGGGRGIRSVESEGELEAAFLGARAEAKASFGDSSLYLEKRLSCPRHIEIQIIADLRGNFAHLAERDCTVQRRRQKLLEEAPSPTLNPDLRGKMANAALKLLQEVRYASLGTVEFLLDRDKNFYFMEVNARAQVEHTVTEEVTNIDLIREQLQIAAGTPLSFDTSQVEISGHALQLRINAENPKENFCPSPGKLTRYLPPGGPHVRVDSACYWGYHIPPYYDSLLAKLIVWGSTRDQAIAVARRALREFHIEGVHSTISAHQAILQDASFLRGSFDLGFVDQKFAL